MTDPPNAVTVKFKLTSADVFLVLFRYTMRKMWFLLLIPIIGAISVAFAILDPTDPRFNMKSGLWVLAFGAVIFVVQPYLQMRASMKNPNFGGLMTLTISQQGTEFTGEHSNSRVTWSMVKGASEMKHAILIHLNPVGFQIVPKRQLSREEVSEFRNFLRIHAPGNVKLAKA